MARVYGITIPAGIEVIYNKTIKMYDISVHCNVGKNRRFMTRRMKLKLKEWSKLTGVASAWHMLSQADQDAWYTAADAQGTNGYSLWTQDKIYRLVMGLAGNATPSTLHQYKVGHINLAGGATSCKIKQEFNRPFTIPTTLTINYKGALTADGADPYAKVRFWSTVFFGGNNIELYEDINLTLDQAWESKDISVAAKSGTIASFRVEIWLNDVVGDLYFDNVFCEFDGQVQNDDPFCDEIEKTWRRVSVPAGVTVESVYPTGAAL